MPRRQRMYLPGFPYHIVQRGNNREACFLEREDYQTYLKLWEQVSQRYGVKVHAFCLMTNHIHFLATPSSNTALSNTLKVVGSRYAQYFNKKYKRSGTLWEGRHRSSLVQSERYFLICMAYIELNPVRAKMVKLPEEYHWSSYHVSGLGGQAWLTPHEEYLGLGVSSDERCRAYREIIALQRNHSDAVRIRTASHYNQPLANKRFRAKIEQEFGISLGQSKRGRPRKPVGDAS